jgi:uncharacterized protein YbaA (DUF1428 family)
MAYVDGFVLAVPTENKAAYTALAETALAVFKDQGALECVECWGDDVPDGKLTSFPMAVQCNADETVVFAWIVWPSRQVRDEGHKKAMADPRMEGFAGNMPFDGKRMIFGGFDVIVKS